MVCLIVLKSFWIVSPSCGKSRISPDIHTSICRSNAFECSLDFDFWDDFCSSKLGIIIIALNAMSFKGESCNHSFISLVGYSINYFLARPDRNKNKLFFQYTIFGRLVTGFPQISNCHILRIYIVPLVFQCSPEDWLSSRVFSSVTMTVSLTVELIFSDWHDLRCWLNPQSVWKHLLHIVHWYDSWTVYWLSLTILAGVRHDILVLSSSDNHFDFECIFMCFKHLIKIVDFIVFILR